MAENERHETETVNEALKRSEQLKKGLDRFVRLLRGAKSGAVFDAHKQVHRTRLLDDITNLCNELTVFLKAQDLRQALSTTVSAKKLGYKALLEEALGKHSLEIMGEWPVYVVCDIVRLEVKLDRLEALIDGRRASSIEPDKVVGAVKKRLDSLLTRDFDPNRFRKALSAAYEKTAAESSAPGGYVALRTLYQALVSGYAKAKSGYSEQQFAVDLYRSLGTGGDAKIELSPAQDARGGIYVPAPRASGNYIAALRFH